MPIQQESPKEKKLKPDKPPFSNMPNPESIKSRAKFISPPDDQRCFQLWDQYNMLENVREHSFMVARIATFLAEKASGLGLISNPAETRASALLHDLAKSYCLRYGGSHAILGASWTLQETRNPEIAQGVLLHVSWPWKLPDGAKICSLPFLVMYADKRVKHAERVTLSERFEDLLVRYGKTEAARKGIRDSWDQARIIEQKLSYYLEIDLNEYSFNCGRMVD